MACAALANITCHRGANDEADGAVAALCTAMRSFPNVADIQAAAFSALSNMCMDNEKRLKEFAVADGVSAMTMALQKPWKSKMAKHTAISNLSILLRCLTEYEEAHGGDDEEASSEAPTEQELLVKELGFETSSDKASLETTEISEEAEDKDCAIM